MNLTSSATPLNVVAQISRIATKAVDRVTGDRSDYSLLLSLACAELLRCHGIDSHIIYGKNGWVEVTQDDDPFWAGAWGENTGFWVQTIHNEIVDLNLSVAHRKKVRGARIPSKWSPPNIWGKTVPQFLRYYPEGVAEIDPSDMKSEKDLRWLQSILDEVHSAKVTSSLKEDEEFINEPMICPDGKLFDDTKDTFKHYDRILRIKGIPPVPVELRS